MRNPLRLAMLVPLLSAARLVQASTVTTNDYNAGSTDNDINKSRKDLDLDSTGKLPGTCNPSTTVTSLSLESYAQCNGGTLEWGSGGFIDNLSGANIAL